MDRPALRIRSSPVRSLSLQPFEHLVTSCSSADSAAGATAFSCGVKTYNGAIGVTPSLQPCGTILEAAKRQGYMTGLVATSRITHATPASFYAHVPDRDLESEIAEFLVGEDGSASKGLRVDFAFGGGKCFFLPNGTDGSCRTDGKDMLGAAKAKGVRVIDGMAALRAYKDEDSVDEPVLGLFASDVRSQIMLSRPLLLRQDCLQHMEYEVDRQRITALADEQPSLKEMCVPHHQLSTISQITTVSTLQGYSRPSLPLAQGSR